MWYCLLAHSAFSSSFLAIMRRSPTRSSACQQARCISAGRHPRSYPRPPLSSRRCTCTCPEKRRQHMHFQSTTSTSAYLHVKDTWLGCFFEVLAVADLVQGVELREILSDASRHDIRKPYLEQLVVAGSGLQLLAVLSGLLEFGRHGRCGDAVCCWCLVYLGSVKRTDRGRWTMLTVRLQLPCLVGSMAGQVLSVHTHTSSIR